MQSDRDPRVDPKAGDVLRVGKFDRTVTGVSPRCGAIYYTRSFLLHLPSYRNSTFLGGWRRWAKNAEVIECAKP